MGNFMSKVGSDKVIQVLFIEHNKDSEESEVETKVVAKTFLPFAPKLESGDRITITSSRSGTSSKCNVRGKDATHIVIDSHWIVENLEIKDENEEDLPYSSLMTLAINLKKIDKSRGLSAEEMSIIFG